MHRTLIILSLCVAFASGCVREYSSVSQRAAGPTNKATTGTTKTIVLVHGAFADGSSWDRVVPILEANGYNVVAVHQPLTSLADDIAATRRILDAEPGDAVLVGHSYGGAVISEAGTHAKVRALVYIAAFTPDAGESVNDLGKGQPPPPWASTLQIDQGGFARLPADTVAKDFAQDVSSSEARLIWAKQGPIALKNLDEKLTIAAWHAKPSWYVQTMRDHMIAPSAQADMALRIRANVTSLEANHVVMLTKPAEVADVIMAAAAATAR